MTKATHKGTCQVCGCTQRLPGNRLSRHGYHKTYGIFTGTCSGWGEEPWEVSCSVAKRHVEAMHAAVAELEAKAEAILESDVMIVTRSNYRGKTRITETMMLEPGTYTVTGSPFMPKVESDSLPPRRGHAGKWAPLKGNGATGETLAEQTRTQHATNLRRQAAEIREAAMTKQAEIDAWTPGELSPV